MLHRDMPFGLARHRGLAEPFNDPQPQPRGYTSPRRSSHSKSSSLTSKSPPSNRRELRSVPIPSGVLPEDVVVIVLGYLAIADIMTIRRCSKWFKHLTEDRQLWVNFLSHPALPVPACAAQSSTLSSHALEAQVRRQFELSRSWAPKTQQGSRIGVTSSRRFAMPNNESLVAMSSMDNWIAVASDLGGVYVCAPFGEQPVADVAWIRVLTAPCEVTKLRVVVWSESEAERVGVMWAGKVSVQGTAISYHCGLVSALSQDLVAAQMRAQGGILLDSSDFVTTATLDLRNSASEIMDIAIGERYCAIVDAAHIFQVFLHRLPGDGVSVPPSSFQGPHRSSRKTISLRFLPCDQLLIYSDSFVAVYKPVSQFSTTMESKYSTRVPSTSYFGLLTQRPSSSVNLSAHNSTPILALGSDGKELVHFDLRLAGLDADDSDTNSYGLSLRRSISYMQLDQSFQHFAMGTINGGHSRLVWITPTRNKFLGIALGRKCLDGSNPFTLHQSPLIETALDLGEYGELIKGQAVPGPLFVFHEGEGKLLGGQRGLPDLVMLEY